MMEKHASLKVHIQSARYEWQAMHCLQLHLHFNLHLKLKSRVLDGIHQAKARTKSAERSTCPTSPANLLACDSDIVREPKALLSSWNV